MEGTLHVTDNMSVIHESLCYNVSVRQDAARPLWFSCSSATLSIVYIHIVTTQSIRKNDKCMGRDKRKRQDPSKKQLANHYKIQLKVLDPFTTGTMAKSSYSFYLPIFNLQNFSISSTSEQNIWKRQVIIWAWLHSLLYITTSRILETSNCTLFLHNLLSTNNTVNCKSCLCQIIVHNQEKCRYHANDTVFSWLDLNAI